MAPAETRDTLDEIMDDFNMVPIVVQPQLVPNTDVELDVYFDGQSAPSRSETCPRHVAEKFSHADSLRQRRQPRLDA